MKKILLTLLLLSLLPLGASAGPNRSKVAVIWLWNGADGPIYDDVGRVRKAQIFQILENRNIEPYYVEWQGDSTALKTVLVDSASVWGIEMAIFVGGYARVMHDFVEPEDGTLCPFVLPEATHCSVPAIWWWGGDIRDNDAHYALGTTSLDGISLDSTPYHHYYTANYSGALDTLFGFVKSADRKATRGVGLRDGVTPVDTILTYTGYPDGSGEYYLALWSRGSGSTLRYYTALSDGMVGCVIDALICKHVTYFDPLYFAFDIDDFGMDGQGSSGGPNTDPDVGWVIKDSNFWNHIDTLFQVIDDFDLRLTIGATTKYKRSVNAADNQWAKWYGLRTRWKDNGKFAWVAHGHGKENPADSVCALFYNRATYNDFNLRSGAYVGFTTAARMDSIYDIEVDSLEAWGLTVAPYIIPPADNVDGYYDDLQDTIATFCNNNNYSLRSKYAESTSNTVYKDTGEWLGCKVLIAHYMTNTIDTTLNVNTNIAEKLWDTFWGPSFFRSSKMTGLNPGIIDAWNEPLRGMLGYEYNQRHSPVTVLHFGACYKNGDLSHNVQLVRKVGQTIDYLEWLSGKDIYQAKFAHELADDPVCWEQVK